MEQLGRTLFLAGLGLAAIGALVWLLGPKFGSDGGLLPGDISWKRGNVSFYFPIVTCI